VKLYFDKPWNPDRFDPMPMVPVKVEYTPGPSFTCSKTHCDDCGLPNGRHVQGCTFDILNILEEQA
jgi:hypothetical protein